MRSGCPSRSPWMKKNQWDSRPLTAAIAQYEGRELLGLSSIKIWNILALTVRYLNLEVRGI